jgi:DNA mismatch endonuclease (patch repair protein)
MKTRDPRVTSRIMACIPSKNTRPEISLGRLLWKAGVRYRKHYKIPGKPDFAIVSKKVAIFVDGDFWHGNNWRLRGIASQKKELSGYKRFWREKISRNIERDKDINAKLKKEKWKVIRCWESDLKKSPLKAVSKILQKIKGA